MWRLPIASLEMPLTALLLDARSPANVLGVDLLVVQTPNPALLPILARLKAVSSRHLSSSAHIP